MNLVKSICEGLVYITTFIKDENKGESALTIVIKMAQDDDFLPILKFRINFLVMFF